MGACAANKNKSGTEELPVNNNVIKDQKSIIMNFNFQNNTVDQNNDMQQDNPQSFFNSGNEITNDHNENHLNNQNNENDENGQIEYKYLGDQLEKMQEQSRKIKDFKKNTNEKSQKIYQGTIDDKKNQIVNLIPKETVQVDIQQPNQLNQYTVSNTYQQQGQQISLTLRIFYIYETNNQIIENTQFKTIIGQQTPEIKIQKDLEQQENNTFLVKENSISRNHGSVLYLTNNYFVKDYSSIGTFVQLEPLKKTVVNHGDTFAIGRSQFQFQFNVGDANTINLIVYKSRNLLDPNHSYDFKFGIVCFFKYCCINLLNQQILTFGRHLESNFVLDYEEDSIKHCTLKYENNQLYIIDECSSLGTWLRIKKEENYLITNNMVIRFGELLRFKFRIQEE